MKNVDILAKCLHILCIEHKQRQGFCNRLEYADSDELYSIIHFQSMDYPYEILEILDEITKVDTISDTILENIRSNLKFIHAGNLGLEQLFVQTFKASFIRS